MTSKSVYFLFFCVLIKIKAVKVVQGEKGAHEPLRPLVLSS